MAHKVCIDGTAYEIDGGKAMVNGTVYEIDHGTTLVDGTAYEVGFAEMATVTITGSAHDNWAYVVIDGVKYYSGMVTLSVPVGTVISCYADTDSKDVDSGIYLNGVYKAYRSYNHTVTTNTTINLTDDRDSNYNYAGLIYITET